MRVNISRQYRELTQCNWSARGRVHNQCILVPLGKAACSCVCVTASLLQVALPTRGHSQAP